MGCCQTSTNTLIPTYLTPITKEAKQSIGKNDIIYIVRDSCLTLKKHNKRSMQFVFSLPTYNDIQSIHIGYSFMIIVDNQQNYWEWEYQYDFSSSRSPIYNTCTSDAYHMCRQVRFFMKKQIKKICINSNSDHMFWITADNKVYGNGCNSLYQLGITSGGHSTVPVPSLIRALHNTIDIQCGRFCSIALCSKQLITDIYMVIVYWFRICKLAAVDNDIINIINSQLPSDIINLIKQFYVNHDTEVYAAGDKRIWKKIRELENKCIIKISAGYISLFLTENGSVWQYVRDYKTAPWSPTLVTFFEKNSIKIRDIKSGSKHCLAIDMNNNVYIWGMIYNGGNNRDATFEQVSTPRLIESLKGYSNIMDIDCGGFHNYCRTKDNKHLLFGGNYNAQCLVFEDKNVVKEPNCINTFIEKEFENRFIKQIGFGPNSSHIVLSSVPIGKDIKCSVYTDRLM
eukprot:377575_1